MVFLCPQIDYPDVQVLHPGPGQRASVNSRDKMHLTLEPRELAVRGGGSFNSHPHVQQLHQDIPDLLRGGTSSPSESRTARLLSRFTGRSRGSVGSSVRDGSDTSSAYSGSDTMCQSVHSLEDVDLSGLMESVVDSDEEDLVGNVEVIL